MRPFGLSGRAGHQQQVSFYHPNITKILLSQRTTVSTELLDCTVTFSENYDTTMDPFVVSAVPYKQGSDQAARIQYCTLFQSGPGELY